MPGRLGIGALGVTILAMGILALPAVASAKAKTAISVEVGPFKTVKGYSFDLFVGACNGAKSDVDIDFTKGPNSDNIDYDYSGKASCTAKSLKRATVSLNWPKVAKLKVSVSSVLKATKAVTPKGCSGGKGTSEKVELKGSVSAIPSKALGQVHLKKIGGYISKISNLNCKTPAAPTATSLFGEFGSSQFVNADQFAKGSRDVFLSSDFTPPSPGVTGSLFLSLSGKAKLFNISPAGVATLTNVKPFASGKLVATELPLCIGSTSPARNVSLSGAITVNSVFGKVVFGPTTATGGWVAPGSAFPADCNGYGSTPLTPALDNVCSTDGFCSISEGTNVVDIDDVSDAGTQTIVSETIDFGDGTPAGTFTNGSVSHIYATAGTYTATVTIETSNGQTQTVTTPVYIDS